MSAENAGGTAAARVTFLGTGTSHGVPMIGCGCATCHSPDPRDRRLRPSIVVEVRGGPSILVDTSTDLRQQALTAGVARVDAILFTHSHADHVMGMDEIRRFNVMQKSPIPAYADAPDGRGSQAHVQLRVPRPDEKGGGVPQIDLRPIDGPLVVHGVSVTPVPILHGQRPILGFRFGSFAYLTDCSGIPEASWALLEGLDVLVLDALRHKPHPTHFTVEEAVAAIATIQPRRALLTHICHDLPHEETNRALPSGVELAYDGLQLDVRVATT